MDVRGPASTLLPGTQDKEKIEAQHRHRLKCRASCGGRWVHATSVIHGHIFFKCSEARAPSVKSPVLVLHGTHDTVIDLEHGIELCRRCPRAVPPLFIEVSEIPASPHNVTVSQ